MVRRRNGFTLIELLVVIAIIAVLIGLLLPAVQKVREAAARTKCHNNMHQLGLAFHNYEGVYQSFPPAYTLSVSPLNSHAWGPYLLPYIEQSPLAQNYNFTQPFVTPGNQAVVTTPLKIMQCPSTPTQDRVYTFVLPAGAVPGLPKIQWQAAASDYGVTTGILGSLWDIIIGPPSGSDRGGALQANQPCRIAQITDGTSQTILLGEIAGRPDIWHKGKQVSGQTEGAGWGDPLNGENWFSGSLFDGTGSPGPCVINCTNESGRGLYSFHTGGATILLADGSVRFLSEGASARTIAYLVTRGKNDGPPDF
jgi:prepilin-type N-terminal cleavage/methylation domain-containing protein/prepilin-type processing-associated H-X9-DG protein